MLGFSLQTKYNTPMPQVLKLLKSAGFDAISPAYGTDLETIADCVRDLGMTIQSLHAPQTGIPLLWQPANPMSAAPQAAILDSLENCARYQIPVLVLHGWQGLDYRFPAAPDFRFFDRLVIRAEQLGVSLAFENLEGEEYHTALLERYAGEKHVGFCWDSGHDRCYPHRQDYLETFGNRLIMTHLNDNLGVRSPDGSYTTQDDLHYLPGDGNTDWDTVLRRLAKARKQDVLNFELKTHTRMPADNRYVHISLEDFIAQAGHRAKQIANKYTTING